MAARKRDWYFAGAVSGSLALLRLLHATVMDTASTRGFRKYTRNCECRSLLRTRGARESAADSALPARRMATGLKDAGGGRAEHVVYLLKPRLGSLLGRGILVPDEPVLEPLWWMIDEALKTQERRERRVNVRVPAAVFRLRRSKMPPSMRLSITLKFAGMARCIGCYPVHTTVALRPIDLQRGLHLNGHS